MHDMCSITRSILSSYRFFDTYQKFFSLSLHSNERKKYHTSIINIMFRLLAEVGKVLDRLYSVIELLVSQLGGGEELLRHFPSYHSPCSKIKTSAIKIDSISNSLHQQQQPQQQRRDQQQQRENEDNNKCDVNTARIQEDDEVFRGTEIVLPVDVNNNNINNSSFQNKCLKFFCQCSH